MPNWNLPAFADGALFPPASNAGKWQQADTTLRRLSASLKVDGNAFVDPHEPVRAIPDPWAQARTFAEALISGDWDHPLHDEVLSQWRGLLALFALRDLYPDDYTITPHRLELNGDGLFDRVLSHLTPQIALGGKAELWRQPVIFRLNNQAIALGNPACLVSAGRLTADLSFDKIPWYRNGLHDPTKCELPVTQLFLLSNWLQQLWRELASINGDVADKLRELLMAYIADCDRLVGSVALVAKLGPSHFQELGEPYSRLFATAALERIDQPWTTSQTRLALNPSLKLGALKGIILVDPALTHDQRFNPRNTLVWGTRTLGELLNSADVFKKAADEAANHGWMIITGEDIFTPRVAVFKDGANIAGNPQGMEQMLMPLRPLALMLPDGPNGRIEARAGGGKVMCTLKLQIDDGTQYGLNFDFTRHYSLQPEPGEGLLVEDEDWKIYHTSVWPDIQSTTWSNYFARFNYQEQKTGYMVRPVQALSAQLLAAEAADQGNAIAAIDRLREVNAGKQLSANSARWKRSQRVAAGEYEEVQFARTPFEAIAYIDAFGDRRDAPAGMAMIRLKAAAAAGSTFNVAVDFGTTNTVACLDDGEPVCFKDRMVYPLAYSNPEMSSEELFHARWLVRKFFPPELRQTPTPTVALNRVPFPSQEAHQVFRNVIYFHSHESYATNSETDELAKFKRVATQAKFNLKWTDDAEHAEASTDFLSQFVLMVAVEALAGGRDPSRIRWRFSVPDSLDGEMRLNFEDNLREITALISTGVEKPRDVLHDLYSEGLAAAEFILDGSAFTRGSLNFVLDIGGGTTDVTIWDVGPVHWIGSFRLAGQNFFTRTISQNPEILTPLGLGHWQALFQASDTDGEGVSRKDIPHLAEMLFSGPALGKAIDEHWNSRLKLDVGRNLRLISLTFLAGMAWYLGRIARQLIDDGRLREDQLANVAFALCGRGAGLFKKMHAGREADQESEATRALEVFAIAAGSSAGNRPQLFTTPDAKLEVVRGMISSKGDAFAEAANAERFYSAGLNVTFEQGEPLVPSKKTARSDIPSKVRNVDISELKEFLVALNSKTKIVIDLKDGSSQGAEKAIALAVHKAIDEVRSSKDINHELEPPFIMALRALIDIMALPAADRDRRLTMEFRK